MRALLCSLILISSLVLMAAPAIAQDATPESEVRIDVGLVEGSCAAALGMRFTYIGAINLGGAAGELDGSIENPVDVATREFLAEYEQLQIASAPDIGDERAMLVGTIPDDDFDFEVALLVVQSGDIFIQYTANGFTMIVGDLLRMVDSIAERNPETVEEWLPTLEDLPPGFTLDTSADEDDDDNSLC